MPRRTGLAFFLLFVFSSTFSIALSQTSLGISIILTVAAMVRERFSLWADGLRWFWTAMAAYVGWLVLVCLLQDVPLYSLDHIREEWLFGIIPVGVYLMRERRNGDLIVGALAAGVVVVSAASLVMYATGVEYSWATGLTEIGDGSVAFRGNFAHRLTFGNYVAVAAVFLIGFAMLTRSCRRWATGVAAAGGAAGIVAVLFAGSRGPIIATGVGLLILILFSPRRPRWAAAIGLIAIVCAVALSPGLRERFGSGLVNEMNMEAPRSRTFIWKTSVSVVADHPWIGAGPGNFGEAYSSYLPPDISPKRKYTHAHNDFLQAAARSGIPGGVLFLGLWLAALRLLWLGRRKVMENSRWRGIPAAALAASVAFLVASLSEATFADEEVRAILMLVWAVGLAVWYNDETGSMAIDAQPTT